jgi:hypothetical protein
MQKKKTNSVSQNESNPLSKGLDVELYKNRADIIRKTAEQVQKDFGQFGMIVSFSENEEMVYKELFDQLTLYIEGLLSHDTEKLMALLYQIDLNQNKVFEAEKEYPDWTHAEIMTELILYRELKKVILRTYIKENPDWLNT